MDKLTIRDVAQLAGVSHMTVSRTINNKGYIKKDTKEKILKIIKEYGYEPDIVARSLKTKKSKTIGLIVGYIDNPFYTEIANGIINFCEKLNYNVIVCNSGYNYELAEKYINMLLQKHIEGILITTINLSKETIEKINNRKIPFVLITVKLDIPCENYIISDDYYGGLIATQYLLKMGHRKIYFLRTVDAYSSNERIRAFKEILTREKLYYDDNYFSNPVASAKEGYKETIKFLGKNNGFTAIMAGNDSIAIGAMRAIFKLNLRVPDDISLIGYDNLEISDVLKVPLTTVAQQELLFGKLSAQRLIAMIEDTKIMLKPLKLVVKPTLSVRHSVIKYLNYTQFTA